MTAELTLCNLAERIVEIVLRHAKRTRIDAIPAANTGVGIVADDAGHRILSHCAYRADRDARRIDTMQAMPFDKRKAVNFTIFLLRRAVAIDFDDVQRSAGQVLGRIPSMFIPIAEIRRDFGRHFVGGLTSRNARFAADAEGGSRTACPPHPAISLWAAVRWQTPLSALR